jgi:hypothetical protein
MWIGRVELSNCQMSAGRPSQLRHIALANKYSETTTSSAWVQAQCSQGKPVVQSNAGIAPAVVSDHFCSRCVLLASVLEALERQGKMTCELYPQFPRAICFWFYSRQGVQEHQYGELCSCTAAMLEVLLVK